jgi:hypothetical protein
MTLPHGAKVPDLVFVRPDGTPVRLATFAGRPLVLVFLRHLG